MSFFGIILTCLVNFILGHLLFHNKPEALTNLPGLTKEPLKIEAYLPESFHPRAAYGAPTQIEEFPFYASLESCGASIIYPRWVITAAHCVANKNPAKVSVWLGGENFENSQKLSIDRIIVHPLYIEDVFLNDIALVRLVKPLTFSDKIQPLNLPYKDEYNEVDVIHTLVGKEVDEDGKPNEDMKATEIARLPASVCTAASGKTASIINYFMPMINELMMCGAHVMNIPDVGFAEIGSPMVKSNTLIGIISHRIPTENENDENTRIVFLTNVSHFVSWIESVTGFLP